MKIIYIHGLNSSKESQSVQTLSKYFKDDLIVPDLPNNPKDWIDVLEPIISKEFCILIGSSTGGYFARYFANKYKYPVILINPLINASDLMQFVGLNQNYYTNEEWFLEKADIYEICKYYIEKDCTIQKLVIVGSNDKILDPRKTIDTFKMSSEVKITSGDHQLNFEEIIEDIQSMINITCIY